MNLIFLKLGGSLITEKDTPGLARTDIIKNISGELALVLKNNKDLKILIGHGSGSFGHVSAKKYKTINGVSSKKDWHGFSDVWFDARKLNQIVVECFKNAGLDVMSFPPSTSIISNDKKIVSWDISTIKLAIKNNLIPVIYGDAVFDSLLGGTILSTEDLFFYLAKILNPNKILIAGEEKGVYQDFPECITIIPEITQNNFNQIRENIGGSKYTDVTGGMIQKVKTMLELTHFIPDIQILIFSALEPGSIKNAFLGISPSGSLIHK